MTNTIHTYAARIFLLGILIAFALGLNYLNAWTAPTQAPPNGNVPAPLNTGTGVQSKSGGLQMSSLDVIGATGASMSGGQLSFWSGSISLPQYTIDMGPLDPGANNGIRFPDGSVQTTAGATLSGTGAIQIVGYVCQGNPDCNGNQACTSFGQNPTCTSPICPTGTTRQSYDEIDRWTDSGCTNIGSGGQCQGPWSRTYVRVVGLCS